MGCIKKLLVFPLLFLTLSCDGSPKLFDVETTIEICDGVDNDLDGLVDNTSSIADSRLNKKCGVTDVGRCQFGKTICNNGEVVCSGNIDPQPETCMREGKPLDIDCDGEYSDVPSKGYCYSGPEGTELSGICHPGVWICLEDQWVCRGEQTPSVEICDDLQSDEDCDGESNENLGTLDTPSDILFIVDYSCSMGPEVPIIIKSIEALINNRKDIEDRYALLDVATPPVRMITNFISDKQTFIEKINVSIHGGSEVVLDTLFRVANGSAGLNWGFRRPRIVVVFTDEYLISSLSPVVTIQEAGESLRRANMFLIAFVLDADRTEIEVNSNGKAFNILDITEESIVENIEDVLKKNCPRN